MPDDTALSAVDESHRLAFIKHLLSAAIDDARQPEPFCSKAILDLHDAVELFLALIAEHVGAEVPRRANFLDYWPALKAQLGEGLPLQPAMKRLNQARVGLKHYGIRPSSDEVADLATKTVSFFDEASLLIFKTPFVALSAVSLVPYEPAASRLRRAEELIEAGLAWPAAAMCGLAFDDVLELFLSEHRELGKRSPFPNLGKARHYWSVAHGIQSEEKDRDLDRYLETVSNAFAEMEPVLLMLALGLEYRQFARFRKVIPSVEHMRQEFVKLRDCRDHKFPVMVLADPHWHVVKLNVV